LKSRYTYDISSLASGQVEIEIPYPAVFWACSSKEETLESPFDRLHVGYDDLFPRDTVFWHVDPQPEGGSRLMNTVTVPVLNDEGVGSIRSGTAIAVAMGFAWVLWKLVSVMLKSDRELAGTTKDTTQKKSHQK
jgi:hypothetical protein